MSFWSWLNNTPDPQPVNAGDPHGVELLGEETSSRSLPQPVPSGWSGWPAEWATPNWQNGLGLNKLIDAAWAAIDLNASVLAAMPMYRMQSGKIASPLPWMSNPDPIYSSWFEFAKQLFWDYQLGEAFVLDTTRYTDGWPQTFRVIPPWLINVEMRNGGRAYSLGGQDVTSEILHIRYQSTTDDAHGHGPLECAGARMTAAGVLTEYATRLAETGGTPHYWINTDRKLSKPEADDLLAQWVQSRTQNLGYPAILSGGVGLNSVQSMSAKDMALLELAQFNESRIAVLLGVPPFLLGLPGGGDSLTYSNVSSLFDFHDRSSLRPKAAAVMSALSGWALPRGQTVELNRDEYSRPALQDRANAYKVLFEIGALSAEEIRTMERFTGPAAPAVLTGADLTGSTTQAGQTQEGAG